MAAGASIWTWGVCPLVRSACSCSSALARQAWIFGRSIPGSSETAPVRRISGSVRRTLAGPRRFQARHRRRCASASAGITHSSALASSASERTGNARRGPGRSVRRDHGSGGRSSATTTETVRSLRDSAIAASTESVRTRAKNPSGSTMKPPSLSACGMRCVPRDAPIRWYP